jgi:hypothetical protein
VGKKCSQLEAIAQAARPNQIAGDEVSSATFSGK